MVDADYELLSRGGTAAEAQLGQVSFRASVRPPACAKRGVREPVAPGAGDRRHRSGRLVPRGAAARARLRGDRPGPVVVDLGSSEHLRDRIELVRGDLLDPGEPGGGAGRRYARTSCITWPRRRSCPTHGVTRRGRSPRSRARPRHCWRRCGTTPAKRASSSRPRARCSARRPRALNARTPPAGRRRRTRARSSSPTSSSASSVPTTGCSPARGSSTTTSPSAGPSSS